MGVEDVKRDISRSHTIQIDEGEWTMPGEMPDSRRPQMVVSQTRNLPARRQDEQPQAPRNGYLPEGIFGQS